MAERKFNFISPGVYIDEIDNSQLTRNLGEIGPVIIGRTERGPANRPVKVSSFSEFIEMFGNPIPGGGNEDVWRNGNYIAPTYAAYAAQAWLKNNNAATIVRLLGDQHTNKTTAGKAGWQTPTIVAPHTTTAQNGGAYGLFMIDSASSNVNQTGTLAAVLYAASGTYFTLSGTSPSGALGSEAVHDAAATYIKSVGNKEFVLHVRHDGTYAGATYDRMFRVNFTEQSPNYIRRALNTNPTLTNSTIASSTASYWLGETFDGMVSKYVTSTGDAAQYAWIAALHDGSNNHANKRKGTQPARTGWITAQDVTANTGSFQASGMQKLFRLIAMESGEWEQSNLKISITDIKRSTNLSSPYGTFTVLVRMANDNDSSLRVVERYSGCNLNPNSPSYVAAKIGDSYSTWDDTARKYKHYGTHQNLSKHIRVDMNIDVDAGAGNSDHLPWGFVGAPRYTRFALSGAVNESSGAFVTWNAASQDNIEPGTSAGTLMLLGSGAIGNASFIPAGLGGALSDHYRNTAPVVMNGVPSASHHGYFFPAPLLRISESEGDAPSLKQVYWGVKTSKKNSTAFDESYKDMVRMLSADLYSSGDASVSDNDSLETSYYFTLDDISSSGDGYIYVSGSRQAALSYRGAGGYSTLLDAGLDRFTVDLHGGFDGFDITEKEPLRNGLINDASAPKDRTSYVYNTVKRGIDAVADAEAVEYNLMVAPGYTNEGITSHMVSVCEDRGDALAIIDLENMDGGDYIPFTENNSAQSSRKGTVQTAVGSLRERALNSSYGCAYYPWVQIKDTSTGTRVWVPPSVVALGTFSSAEKRSELWFAPAGFNRGGLTEGAAGLQVVNTSLRLSAADRDTLYAANINPIATFPAEGIVIFGQKTLQVTPSALDRVNVRRLMIFIKKRISRMAASVLFDQNVAATWQRFISKAEPFLRSVKLRFGLDEFKIVLDETTTTPDLIDRNIMYAKIFLKPTKAIEFIALDFTITNDGAAFAD